MRRITRSATKPFVTTGAGDIANNAGDAEIREWSDIRANDTIQFEPVQMPEAREPPGWLTSFFEALGELLEPIGRLVGLSAPVLLWILAGLAVVLLLYILWKLLVPVFEREPRHEGREDGWAPVREEALALLEDADRLAAEGRYGEATHLLLQRSVGQVAAARPDWVEPSSTARELAALPALPDRARGAFATIAQRVEQSLFALKQLGAEDWQAARAAYADFALQQLPGQTA